QEISETTGQRTAIRCLNTEPQPDGMGPMRDQVCGVGVLQAVASRRAWLGMAEDVADAAVDVAAIVKRHGLKSLAQGNARLKIQNHFGVSANRHGKGVQNDRVSPLIAQRSLRNN